MRENESENKIRITGPQIVICISAIIFLVAAAIFVYAIVSNQSLEKKDSQNLSSAIAVASADYSNQQRVGLWYYVFNKDEAGIKIASGYPSENGLSNVGSLIGVSNKHKGRCAVVTIEYDNVKSYWSDELINMNAIVVNDINNSNDNEIQRPSLSDLEDNTNNSDLSNQIKSYNLNVYSNNETYGTVRGGSGSYEEGTLVTIIAVPYSGYIFEGWYENDRRINTEKIVILTMNEDKNIEARFGTNEVFTPNVEIMTQEMFDNLSYITNESNEEDTNKLDIGKVDINKNGDEFMLSASPKPGYVLSKWLDKDDKMREIGSNNPLTINGSSQRNLIAIFIPGDYSVTTSVYPYTNMGVVFVSENYKAGEEVTVEAVPADGYSFKEWREDNKVLDLDKENLNPYTFILSENRNLTAVFETRQCDVSVKLLVNGITYEKDIIKYVDGIGKYQYGSYVSVEAKMINDVKFIGWYLNGEEVSKNAKYDFCITSDVELVAKYERTDKYNITIITNPIDGGYVSGGSSGEYEAGAFLELVANPYEGYEFEGWYENGMKLTPSNIYSLTVESSRTLYANYISKMNNYSVTFFSDGELCLQSLLADSYSESYTFRLPEEQPISDNPNAKFLGWSLSPEALKIEYESGEDITLYSSNGQIELYAVWK